MIYSEMSDTEINARVAKTLDGVTRVNLPIDGTTLFHAPRIQMKRNGKWEWFDPCNSWADAGPIIQENGINLFALKVIDSAGLKEWEAMSIEGYCHHWGDLNPLRVVTIVFLKR